jgi:hypothetical protein
MDPRLFAVIKWNCGECQNILNMYHYYIYKLLGLIQMLMSVYSKYTVRYGNLTVSKLMPPEKQSGTLPGPYILERGMKCTSKITRAITHPFSTKDDENRFTSVTVKTITLLDCTDTNGYCGRSSQSLTAKNCTHMQNSLSSHSGK